MRGCSPTVRSIFDTHRAAGSFAHATSLSKRRIPVAGRHGVPGFRSGSVPRTCACQPSRHGFPEAGHSIGRSISRQRLPDIRLGRDAFGEFRSGLRVRRGRPASPGFVPPSGRDARAGSAGRFVSGRWERMPPVRPVPRFPGSLPKRAPTFGMVPGGRGANAPSGPSRHARSLPGFQAVPRRSSSRRIVRACAMPLDAAHPGRGSSWRFELQVRIGPENSRRSAVKTRFSRSRP